VCLAPREGGYLDVGRLSRGPQGLVLDGGDGAPPVHATAAGAPLVAQLHGSHGGAALVVVPARRATTVMGFRRLRGCKSSLASHFLREPHEVTMCVFGVGLGGRGGVMRSAGWLPKAWIEGRRKCRGVCRGRRGG